jgi:hypothetical protein
MGKDTRANNIPRYSTIWIEIIVIKFSMSREGGEVHASTTMRLGPLLWELFNRPSCTRVSLPSFFTLTLSPEFQACLGFKCTAVFTLKKF